TLQSKKTLAFCVAPRKQCSPICVSWLTMTCSRRTRSTVTRPFRVNNGQTSSIAARDVHAFDDVSTCTNPCHHHDIGVPLHHRSDPSQARSTGGRGSTEIRRRSRSQSPPACPKAVVPTCR